MVRITIIYIIDSKWLSTPQAKKATDAAKAKALAEFQRRFPNTDTRHFTTEVVFDETHNGTGEVEYKAGLGWLQYPEEIDEKNWSRALWVALGFGNFPYQLLMTRNVKKPLPAVDFANSVSCKCWWAVQPGAKSMSRPHSTGKLSQTRKSSERQGKRQGHGWKGQT